MSLDVAIIGCSRMGGDWSLHDRRVPHHYLACWLSGEAVAVADGRELRLGPGAAWWLAPGVPHSLRPAHPRRGFRFHHLRFACPAPCPHRVLALPRAPGLDLRFAQLHEAWRGGDALAPTAFRLQLAALCTALLRQPAAAGPALDAGLVAHLGAWVAGRLPRPIHPRELAAQAGMSPDWFARRLAAACGLPPRTWLLHERVRWAAALLAEGGLTAGAVAARAGFANPALFSRQFRQVMGLAPRAWLAAAAAQRR